MEWGKVGFLPMDVLRGCSNYLLRISSLELLGKKVHVNSPEIYQTPFLPLGVMAFGFQCSFQHLLGRPFAQIPTVFIFGSLKCRRYYLETVLEIFKTVFGDLIRYGKNTSGRTWWTVVIGHGRHPIHITFVLQNVDWKPAERILIRKARPCWWLLWTSISSCIYVQIFLVGKILKI